MALSQARSQTTYIAFLAGVIAGMVLGFLAGHMTGGGGGSSSDDTAAATGSPAASAQTQKVLQSNVEALKALDKPQLWTPITVPWIRLPYRAPTSGSGPQTFAVPTAAYAYGAISQPLSGEVAKASSIIRIEVSDVTGQVGVSLAKPDGSAIVSGEQPVTAKDGAKALFFRAPPESYPLALLVRNYDAQGTAGLITIKSVAFAHEASLKPEQMAALLKVGLN